ncbi:MAG: DNA (cytosine-5-)-methyltransferase [Chloroflexota bacterium]|nr:DNA (cytosine-5-)-methyltransferase [Chloroflexota bacterium]
MRALSLFSGIGGFDLACEWAGIEVAGQVEIDPFCQRVLAKHWPDVPRMGDIREVRGDEFGAVDVICGGFPCQPVSQAGKRRGEGDDRWLWPEMHRLVDHLRPTWVVGENVYGLVSMGLDGVLSDMESLGYVCWTAVLPACAVGAPHRRDRVWIVAHSQEGGFRRERTPRGAGQSPRGGEDVADAESDLWRASGDDRPVAPDGRGQRSATGQVVGGLGRGADGLSPRLDGPLGWGPGWEDGIPRVTAHEPDRANRLKALGNAIVPEVAYQLLREMTA